MAHVAHLQILPGTGNRGPHSKERYFLEIRNRYKWLLDMGGERVLLYKKKYVGERSATFDNVRKRARRHGQHVDGFGGSIKGGYFDPIEIVVNIMQGGPEAVILEELGRRRAYTLQRSWTLWEPLLQNQDVIVRRNGQRFWLLNIYQHRWKHFVTRQDFDAKEIERNHPVFDIPM